MRTRSSDQGGIIGIISFGVMPPTMFQRPLLSMLGLVLLPFPN